MRLKEIRNIRGFSQQYLSEKLNVKQTTISSYETGTTEPSLENLIKLADALEVSIDTLLGHNANVIDLSILNVNQKEVVNKVVYNLNENDVTKVLGYIDSLERK